MKRRFTILTAALALLTFLAVPMGMRGQTREPQTASYGFETNDASWTATTFVTNNTAITAHGGSKYGATNGSTASLQYNAKVASPQSLTCYYSKTTTNTHTGSHFEIQVSSNNSTWTTVASGLGMNEVTKGTWYELTADLSSYSNVFVRVYYDGTTGVRALDDITLVYSDSGVAPVENYEVDFESSTTAYDSWTFDNMTSNQTGTITAHGGTYYGTTGGKESASITTSSKVENPGTLTCYVSKQSTNTTASTWYIQVSSNGTSWTDVESRSATDMDKGEWKKFTANLSSYSNVFVRVYYSGSTAVRNIDDLTLTTVEPSSAVSTTTTINVPSDFKTDIYQGTNAGTLTATVKDNENNTISGATVTWSSSNTGVATIDANGAVTLVAVGTTTITARYAGVEDQYRPSEATYTLIVTSSAPVVDYAVLPFVWQGGSKSTFLALNGVTARGLGSDYAAGNAPYLIKLDDTGDYIQVKTDSQPGIVTIGVKMLGGPNTSTITIQGSANGETFTDIEELTISGNQNDELTLETTNVFAATDRYVRILFTKGSNVGVGPITITCGYSLSITGYGTGNGNWYLIASPVTELITPSDANGFLTNEYDLYYFDQTADKEWRNYEDEEGVFTITNGTGYLYASQTNTTLVFTGSPYSGGSTKNVTLKKETTNPDTYMHGWNLVGNPFNQTAYIQDGRNFYVMGENNDGDPEIILSTTTSIGAMEGVFVMANNNNESMTFTTTQPTLGKSKRLALNLTKGRSVIDCAIVRFDEGQQLPKFQLNRNNTKVYIQQDGQDYAVVKAEENMGELPVSFRAKENGTYSLSINAEDVSFGYLHLIDNMTGTDVDLLANPSYTFEANITDYASRFRLVFATGTADDTFAFNSNGEWIVNNEGNATLQVIDLTGRIVSSESISGVEAKTITAAPGVYMLRLINGNDVKTQKIVVK